MSDLTLCCDLHHMAAAREWASKLARRGRNALEMEHRLTYGAAREVAPKARLRHCCCVISPRARDGCWLANQSYRDDSQEFRESCL